jgi:hypothetical protein
MRLTVAEIDVSSNSRKLTRVKTNIIRNRAELVTHCGVSLLAGRVAVTGTAVSSYTLSSAPCKGIFVALDSFVDVVVPATVPSNSTSFSLVL